MAGPDSPGWPGGVGLVVILLTVLVAVHFYRRLARRIHRTEKQLKELLEAAPFAIAVTRRNTGEFLFANRRAISQLALSPTDYRHQRVPYVDAEALRRALLQIIELNQPVLDREVELVAYDGRRFPALGSVVPIEFAGEPALIGTFQDISGLKEAEVKLRASEARLRAVYEAAPDGIVLIRPDGTILHASESCLALLGETDLGKYLGRQIVDFVAEPERPLARDLIGKLLQGEARDPIAFRLQCPDGTNVWVEPRGVPVPDPITGQPTIVLILRNITQRREAQEQLAAHAARLQEALARIAHLQNAILRVCAWTKQVNVDGEWIPIDHYLAKHLGIKVSHGISEQGLAMLEQGALPPAPTPPPPPPAA